MYPAFNSFFNFIIDSQISKFKIITLNKSEILLSDIEKSNWLLELSNLNFRNCSTDFRDSLNIVESYISGAIIHVSAISLSKININYSIILNNSFFQEIKLENSKNGIYGGAVFHAEFPISIFPYSYINNCSFNYIYTLNGALTIFFSGHLLLIRNCTFLNNTILSSGYLSQGNIVSKSLFLFIEKSFLENIISEYDCGIRLGVIKDETFLGSQIFHILETTFKYCRCNDMFGGSVFTMDNTIKKPIAYFKNVSVLDSRTNIGVVKFTSKYFLQITFISFKLINPSTKVGGCFTIFASMGKIFFYDSFITGGTADSPTSSGPASALLTTAVEDKSILYVHFENVKIYNNTGKFWGTHYVIGSFNYFINTLFQDNYIGQGSVANCVFADMIFKNCTFIRNVATRFAAAFNLRAACTLLVTNSNFINNSAESGAVISSSSSHVIVKNCTFISNIGNNPSILELFFSKNSKINNLYNIFENNTVINSPFTSTLFEIIESDIIIKDLFLYNNNAGFLISTLSKIELNNLLMENTTSKSMPLFGKASASKITFYNVIIKNSKNILGISGAFESIQSDVLIVNIYFKNTSAKKINFFKAFLSNIKIYNALIYNIKSKAFFIEKSSLVLIFSKIENNLNIENILNIEYNEGIIYSSESNITVTSCEFKKIYSLNNVKSLFVFQNLKNNYINIGKSIFSSLKNSITSIISFSSGHNFMENNVFLNNEGNLGSCIHFECENLDFCNLLIKKNNFTKNIGHIGSVIYWDHKIPEIVLNYFYLNKVINEKFNNIFYSTIKRINLQIIQNSTNEIKFDTSYALNWNFKNRSLNLIKKHYVLKENNYPGYFLNYIFKFKLIDYYENELPISNEQIMLKELTILNSNRTLNKSYEFLIGSVLSKNINNTLIFDNLIIFGFIGETYILNFEYISNVKLEYFSLTKNEELEKNILKIKIPVSLSGCKIGENFEEVSKMCIPCLRGFYSFKINSTCLKCKKEMDCFGGLNTNTKKGYWRSYNLTDNIYQCFGGEKTCLSNSKCQKEYQGNLCSYCINNEYFKIGVDFLCLKCESLFHYFLFGKLLTITIIMFFFLKNRSISLYSAKTLMVDKIFIMYFFQSFLLIEFNPNNNFIGFYYYSLCMNVLTNFYTFLSLDCILNISNFQKFIIFYLFFIAFSTIFFIITVKLNKNQENKVIMKKLNILFLILIMIQSSYIFTSIRAVSCKSIENAFYMLIDLNEKCEGNYYNILTLFSFLTIIIILGLQMYIFIFIYFIRKIKRKQKNIIFLKDLCKKYYILFLFCSGYQPRYWYWEFVVYIFYWIPILYFGYYRTYHYSGILLNCIIIILQLILEGRKNIFKYKFCQKFQIKKLRTSLLLNLTLLFRCLFYDVELNVGIIFFSIIAILIHSTFIFYYFIIKFDLAIIILKKKNILKTKVLTVKFKSEKKIDV